MQLTMSSPAAREWIRSRWHNMRPWMLFCNTSNFQSPTTLPKLSKRIIRNIDYFQTNYFGVFIFLLIYCIVTSPLLLLALAASLGACYILSLRNAERPLRIMSMEVSLAHQYALVGVCSFPLLWMSGAGAIVFWVLGASLFLILAHSTFYNIESFDNPEDDFQVTIEEV